MAFQMPFINNFGEIIHENASRFPDRTAIVFKEKRCTYQNLETASNQVASAMKACGIRPGEKVGIVSSNRIEFLEVVFGCAKLGAVMVKLNWRLAPGELIHLIGYNDVKLLFYSYKDGRWQTEVNPALVNRKHPVRLVGFDLENSLQEMILSYDDMKRRGSDKFDITFPGGEAPLMHLHTSGTTGVPKCVVYAHKRYINQVAANAYALGFSRDMIFQTMSQLFHSASLGVYASLYVGAQVVLFDHFNAKEYLQVAEKEGTTRLSSVPTVLYGLMHLDNIEEFDLHKIKTIGYGSAPMPQSLIEMTLQRVKECGFMQSYGMTEMGATVTILSQEDHIKDHYKHLSSVGKAIPGVEIRIVGDDGNDCRNGTVGEIVLKGYNVMLEYWKMPEETAKVLVDGWYYSGDLGYLDEDGFLTISGRKNDLIITGAENVYPAEVENVIGEHKDVKAVSVFGVPDLYWGEQVTACVVLKKESRITSNELKHYCRNYIAGYKIPKQIEFVDSLPVNSLGKIDKQELKNRYKK